jgi:hypothetical protein
MFNLIVKKSDNSIYLDLQFNDRDSANKWIAEEQTRKYWDSSLTFEIIDKSPTKEQIDEKNRILTERLNLIATVKDRSNKVTTLPEIRLLIEDLIKAIL